MMLYTALILQAANIVGVPSALLLAICSHESHLQNTIVPHDGGSPSYGICQVKKSTADMMGHRGHISDLMVPEINAKIAAKYLKYQLSRYNNDWCKSVAAYNAGKFIQSSKYPRKPANHIYVEKVKLRFPNKWRYMLNCH